LGVVGLDQQGRAMRWKEEVRELQGPAAHMELPKETTRLLGENRSARFDDNFDSSNQNHNKIRSRKEVSVEDLYPTPPSRQTWSARDFGAIWV
jgi:hypothetical protein